MLSLWLQRLDSLSTNRIVTSASENHDENVTDGDDIYDECGGEEYDIEFEGERDQGNVWMHHNIFEKT